jgi:uncharacterized membrane protein (UPF0127 family)
MNYKNKHTYIFLIILLAIFAFIFFKERSNYLASANNSVSATSSAEIPGSCGNYEKGTVSINNKIINVEISDTECKQELGLSGRTSLPDNTGMIFVFPKDSNYGFWMKDMNFALDMVWIGADFNIVGIEKNVMSDTYDAKDPSLSEVFGQNYIAQYVLELPTGYCDKNNLKIGDKIIFTEKI